MYLTESEKDASRKDAKAPRFGEISKNLSLRAWRLGARNFLEFVLFNISRARIKGGNTYETL
jgi:hypothetical protein